MTLRKRIFYHSLVKYYLIKMNNKVDYLFPNEEYKPKTADMEKIKHYVNVR